MEAPIENIVSLVVAGNLTVNQLMEHEAATTTSTEEPKWTTVMAKNVHQVVSQVVETLVDVPKQEERKLNLRLMGFEVKESEIEKELCTGSTHNCCMAK
jgi:predicted proteasome-type protease